MDESLAGLFQPDVLVSHRYWETFCGKASLPPEKMLMLAVLEDAIECIRKHARTPNSLKFRDEVDWILEEKGGWVFSFENICAVLELDADYIREGLLCWKGKRVFPIRKVSNAPFERVLAGADEWL